MRRMRARYYKYILFFIKMQLKNLDNNKIKIEFQS
jgi:hypothetical protein